jgi:hypothetical protein
LAPVSIVILVLGLVLIAVCVQDHVSILVVRERLHRFIGRAGGVRDLDHAIERVVFVLGPFQEGVGHADQVAVHIVIVHRITTLQSD